MRNMRAVMITVSVRCDVMCNVFVNWSNMLAGFVSWTISGRWEYSIVLGQSLVVS